jgi:pimeloyl-ACP methyl ester carboxylesterase
MPNSTVFPVQPIAGVPEPVATFARRTPFYFESRNQWLFAWLHRPEHALAFDHAVLICSPTGHEQVHSHRSLRHLAEALAEAGFPVLRFDYYGTGDSPGTDEDPDMVATWLANIRDASVLLHQQLGCTRISLVGLRLGATLAAQVAEDSAVDSLILWEPVVKGRRYVREMKALSLTANTNAKPSIKTFVAVEAAGFVLTEQSAQDLNRLDMLQSRPLCRRALIVTRDDAPTDSSLPEHFKAIGIEVQQTAQSGYADMMAEPHYNKIPTAVIRHAVDWLRIGVPAEDRTRKGVGAHIAKRDFTLYPHSHSAPNAFVAEHLIRERVLPISEEPNLFGIISEIPNLENDHLPLIVMINAGSSYRVGPNRLYVYLARQLAVQGFRCLRMDLCGLGDSVAPSAERENDPYPAMAFRDIELTFKHLYSQLGQKRVVLLGLCSGAYAAFQAAVQLANPVLVESLLINPLTFFWREGMSLEASPAQQLKTFWDCVHSAKQPGKWFKFLSGKSKVGIAGAMNLVVQRWKLSKPSCCELSVCPGETAPNTFPDHPLKEDLPGDLERVEKAGRRLACFFSRSDPGFGLLSLYAGQKVKEMQRAGSMSIYFVEEADHTFSLRANRHALAEAIGEHLGRRYPRSVELTVLKCTDV